VASDISRVPHPGLRFVQAACAQLAQVRRLAHELQSQLPRLDVLINMPGDGRRARAQRDGYDLTFAVNHLAPSCSPICCWTSLKESAPSRVIVVASHAHRPPGSTQ